MTGISTYFLVRMRLKATGDLDDGFNMSVKVPPSHSAVPSGGLRVASPAGPAQGSGPETRWKPCCWAAQLLSIRGAHLCSQGKVWAVQAGQSSVRALLCLGALRLETDLLVFEPLGHPLPVIKTQLLWRPSETRT